ncbi:NPC intracellular cholesterol transporter 1 homolog 1 [Caenorhabditis elegans]|uniref:NPC intracellular cholesterol transporter 1 homolog 1 n=1 Tax=Caenorhabditis elegans TaxID=6239 RepID=NPC1A_CAEEL|nr:NPC intracellular cholesterol transporter 1 homolog 1 [Caenorhabditis elegans]Q19127.2 RecName: Full=NPC intracellular cholesterol transporter 1 homolog 1; AltName: Full=Niemann-Pick C1 protein homolog 1; Flags: Precursor [Caenorhabditis elegans]CCD83387.1 NPC intracellular cholesterol transporter 1 homolog 1 [Caenorhabditis elegans]|eukprot:NP_508771.1 NPC intracellular cholesterol transporter 1 homolog 1 [Caenorhabditis elegans]
MKQLLIFCLLFGSIFHHGDAGCIMRGLCQKHTENAYGPCVTNDTNVEPTAFDKTHPAYEKMVEFCPHLLTGDNKLCCTPSQAEGLTKQIAQARHILGRCPSCFDNFAKLWCEFTCSPNQQDFVSISEMKPIEKKEGFTPEYQPAEAYVNTVEYRLSTDFAEGMFSSCKDVTFGGQPALRVMCTSTPCTLTNWLEFIGTQNLDLNIPIHTKFLLYDPIKTPPSDRSTYMNVNFTGCDKSARVGWPACSTSECNKEEYANLIDLDDGKTSGQTCNVHGIACLNIFVMLAFIGSLAVLLCVGFVFTSYDEDYTNLRQTQSGEESPKRNRIKRTGAWIHNFMENNARDIGMMAGRNPKSHFFIGCAVLIFCLPGMIYHKESTNVVDMWSSPRSRARQEEMVFNANFGRPQRYQQIMLLSHRDFQSSGKLYGPVFHKDIFEELFDILNAIKNISTQDSDGRTITLDDVCYRPMGPGYDCLIMSPTNYFQGNKEHLDMKSNKEETVSEDDDAFDYFSSEATTDEWMNHMAACIDQPMSQKTKSGLSCMGTYGGPSAPNMVFGKNSTNHQAANSIMMTILVTQRTEPEIQKAELWEKEFLKFCKEYREKSPKVIFSFMAERSITDEIENDAKDEIVTVVIALAFLIGYVTFSLGRYFVCENQLWSILVHSRICLGMLSVIINLLSSFCSWGIFSMFGIHPVKNALVVQFFVVTLLGVCRTFMVVKYYAQQRVSMPYMSPDQCPEIVGMVMAGTMPAMFSSSLGCAFSFFIGGFTDLPAIRTFCLYAGLAVLIDVVLHCTIFLALFVWDTQRELNGKPEFFFPYQIKDLLGAYLIGRQRATDTFMTQFFHFQVAPFLMHRMTRIITGIIFIASFITTVILSSKISVGFDQSMAFTEKSYISTHFRYLDKFFDVGPPVFFTVDGELDWHRPDVQNKFCTFPGCSDTSFGNIMNYAVGHTEQTYLSGEMYNWIDNYLEWISRKSPCCKVYVHDPNTFCSTNRNKSALDDKACRTCMDFDYVANSYPKSSIMYHRPSIEVFYRHLRHFLEDTPNSECVFGGRASFKDAISFTSRGRIQASQFMTFHKKLSISNSSDFIKAMDTARMVSRRLERSIDDTAHVFAYSKIFPFYEQYSTIMPILTTQLFITVVGVFGIICVTLGIDVKGAACAVICQVSNYFHIVAFMYIFNIPVNALSATNLVMSSGILIEFSVNVLKGYACSLRQRAKDRAESTVGSIGPIILSGPVVTMAGSTMFLSGAHLQIITVYFFKLFLITIVSSAVHALIILPILLAFGGSRGHGSSETSTNDNDEQHDACVLSPTAESHISNVEEGILNRPSLLDASHILDPLLKAEGGIDKAIDIITIDRSYPSTPSSLPCTSRMPRAHIEPDLRSL